MHQGAPECSTQGALDIQLGRLYVIMGKSTVADGCVGNGDLLACIIHGVYSSRSVYKKAAKKNSRLPQATSASGGFIKKESD